MITVYEKILQAGTLTVSVNPSSNKIEDIFDVAQRENPKRAFLFISKVLGHHIPVAPNKTRKAFRNLVSKLPSNIEGSILFVGMAETAVALACGIYQEARNKYPDSVLLLTTRHPTEEKLLCNFKELHSHATDHLLFYPQCPQMQEKVDNAQTLIYIDDETTTGNTFLNLFNALENARETKFRQVITVNLADWSDDGLENRIDADFSSFSLLSGRWNWQPKLDAPSVTMPNVNVSTPGKLSLSKRQDWGRLGMMECHCEIGEHIHAKSGERILVIGTEEFVWPPFLLAERLEKEGADVQFCATTRSPLAQGFAVSSVFTFEDNYGQGIPHFIYNIGHRRYDRIIICAETPVGSLSTSLISKLRSISDTVECLYYE